MRFVKFVASQNGMPVFVNPAQIQIVSPLDEGKSSMLHFGKGELLGIKGTPQEALTQIDGALRD